MFSQIYYDYPRPSCHTQSPEGVRYYVMCRGSQYTEKHSSTVMKMACPASSTLSVVFQKHTRFCRWIYPVGQRVQTSQINIRLKLKRRNGQCRQTKVSYPNTARFQLACRSTHPSFHVLNNASRLPFDKFGFGTTKVRAGPAAKRVEALQAIYLSPRHRQVGP